MTILPAPANTGVRFRRVDLDGKPEIEARVENVTETTRSTTLAKGNVKVHTVEHVLAALAGYCIDNAVVELDANEPPIADGSSREFCRLIQAAGLAPQAEKREFFTPAEPIELNLGETTMTLFPDEKFKITCTSADKQGRFTQFYSTEITPQTWEKELAHARTFCFFEEIEYLFKNGLIKGGSLENAVIIEQINKPLRAAQTFSPPPPANGSPETPATPGEVMGVEGIMKLLPHRPPFLMVDRIVKMEGNTIVGVKNVTINEPYFQGHFPGHPIMPGVLQLEAMAQVAGVLLLKRIEAANQIAYFMSAEDVRWRKPVFPGDVLVIEIELTKSRGKIGKAKGICRVAGEIVSEAEVTFMLRDA